MYPIGGQVFVKKLSGYWKEDPDRQPEHGPYKILEYITMLEGLELFYDIEDGDQYYRHNELRGASNEEELYHKMTQHIEENTHVRR